MTFLLVAIPIWFVPVPVLLIPPVGADSSAINRSAESAHPPIHFTGATLHRARI